MTTVQPQRQSRGGALAPGGGGDGRGRQSGANSAVDYLSANQLSDVRYSMRRSRGSLRSRTQSPRRLKLSAVSIKTTPGKVAIHQALSRYSRPSLSIPPQLGVGG